MGDHMGDMQGTMAEDSRRPAGVPAASGNAVLGQKHHRKHHTSGAGHVQRAAAPSRPTTGGPRPRSALQEGTVLANLVPPGPLSPPSHHESSAIWRRAVWHELHSSAPRRHLNSVFGVAARERIAAAPAATCNHLLWFFLCSWMRFSGGEGVSGDG